MTSGAAGVIDTPAALGELSLRITSGWVEVGI